MKEAIINVDGEKITVKQYEGPVGEISIQVEIHDYNHTEGMYLSREHAYILGKILVSVAKED